MKKNKIRFKVISFIFVFISIVFISNLFFIQVVNDDYKFSAKNNVLRYEVQQPVRGMIYDRNGKLIVANVPSYDLMLIPREIHEKGIDTNKFCQLINIKKTEFIKKLKEAEIYSSYKESIFLKDINSEDASRIGEQLYEFSGFYLRKLTMRDYPTNSATHAIGFLGEVNTNKTKKDKYYIKGDIHGVSGIEASYEHELRGKKGMSIKLVDVHNRFQGKFQKGKFDTLPLTGKSITTTIDIDLQKYAEKLMKNKKGAIVAIEPASGEILSILSSPNYDLNSLIGRDRSKNYDSLKKNIHKPLFNRAILGSYPPGSPFKLINALIALQEKTTNENIIYNCNGVNGYSYGKKKYEYVGCHPHKSNINLNSAIEISCNTYFCEMYNTYFKKFKSSKDAYNNWYNHVRSFGIGEYLGTDFISGSSGKLPTSDYFNKLYNKSWNANTIISMSIGQGELLLTPMQLANITAIIANRGFYFIPHILKKIEGQSKIDKKFTTKKITTIDPKHFNTIIKGMEDVVEGNDGTAKNTKINNIVVCGKTGTAENNLGNKKDHSVYIAFAPKDNPKIAVAVYIENAGWGSTWAAPIGSLMIEKYINNNILNVELENFIINSNLLN